MNSLEAGFLLLTGKLGDPNRIPLTVAQLRNLADRVQNTAAIASDGSLEAEHLVQLGFDRGFARKVLALLEETDLLESYLTRSKLLGCVLLTRVSPEYPLSVRQRLGNESPGCLWCRGEIELLNQPAIALVGSRDLQQMNWEFAHEVGRQAALQGLVLVSGNARGADTTAQEACLEAGGAVISVVADRLEDHPIRDNVLYLSEEDYDAPFSAQRALRRNRVIHCLGAMTIAAQCTLEKGGTWEGCTANLKHHWSPLFVHRDHSAAMLELESRGGIPVDIWELADFAALLQNQPAAEVSLFDCE